MGIRHLNRFLKENASSSIQLCRLSELSGKKIAVDTSIYLYRFASENALIENIYLMISIFRHYSIVPIFIFDGKAPPEKREILQKRKEDREEAEAEYQRLQQRLSEGSIDESEKQEVMYNMDLLKKKVVTVTKSQTDLVKQLLSASGMSYYDAPSEADELCALLNIQEKVWGCLSEDMDMFVYGCKRVIRYLSLLHHTAVVYHVEGILRNLGISQQELREICVLSGTDYNSEEQGGLTLEDTLTYFKKYHKSQSKIGFYEWLHENYTGVIQNYELLKKVYDMFDLTHQQCVSNKLKLSSGKYQRDKVRAILKTDGFLFP